MNTACCSLKVRPTNFASAPLIFFSRHRVFLQKVVFRATRRLLKCLSHEWPCWRYVPTSTSRHAFTTLTWAFAALSPTSRPTSRCYVCLWTCASSRHVLCVAKPSTLGTLFVALASLCASRRSLLFTCIVSLSRKYCICLLPRFPGKGLVIFTLGFWNLR